MSFIKLQIKSFYKSELLTTSLKITTYSLNHQILRLCKSNGENQALIHHLSINQRKEMGLTPEAGLSQLPS